MDTDEHGLRDGAGEKRRRAAAVQNLAEMRSGSHRTNGRLLTGIARLPNKEQQRHNVLLASAIRVLAVI
jgi:hypothetical protein